MVLFRGLAMPTYLCRAAGLDDEAMAALAEAITAIHADVTGADEFFAQVLFEPLDPARCFLGGRRLGGKHCFLHGHIRAGRSARDRSELVVRIVAAVSDILAIPADAVWVYVSELPPRAMAEYGALLPEPGDEASWLEALPEPTRRKLSHRDEPEPPGR